MTTAACTGRYLRKDRVESSYSLPALSHQTRFDAVTARLHLARAAMPGLPNHAGGLHLPARAAALSTHPIG